jgi:hypothetical protein
MSTLLPRIPLGRRAIQISPDLLPPGGVVRLVSYHGLVSANRISMKAKKVSAMTPAIVDLSQVDSTVRAQVLQKLSASGLSEQMFVGHFYRLFAQGQFSLLDLLGPNAESQAAIQELEEGRGVVADSVDDLFADLRAIN